MTTRFVSAKSPRQLEYERYLRSWRWRYLLRPLRIWIDGGRCRMCGTSELLEVHHRDYRWRGNWRFWREVADCTTVCRGCHGDYHDHD